MKKYELKGIIIERERLNNSKEGGPREEVAICLYEEGERVVYAKTATNSSAGYMLSCSMAQLNDRKIIFECHDTKGGSIIIDRILNGYYNRIK